MDLSIVVPVYGCAKCLKPLTERIQKAVSPLNITYEIILVDDCANDNSWPVIEELAQNNKNIKGVLLSRNFGQHLAITAGLAESQGQWIIVMDCDLQDPPELIPKFWEYRNSGHEIILTRRVRKKHPALRRIAAKVFIKMMRFFGGVKFNEDYGSYSMISRSVANAFLQLKDKDRHYLYILSWLGFSRTEFAYEHQERAYGKSSYNLKALINHALSGIFFQTTILLKLIVFSGFAISVVGMFMAAYYVVLSFIAKPPPGWTSLAVLILLIGGFTMISVGIVGLYVGRVFDETRGRPLYVVRKKIN